MSIARSRFEEAVRVDVGTGWIDGALAIPEGARAAVIFSHGSGSSRHSPRNVFVAEALHDRGLATLLIDLLTPDEERRDAYTAQHRFDVALLTSRLAAATDWLRMNLEQHHFRVGYFGASTGAAAALSAAAADAEILAVVSRGGRPDLAGDALGRVHAATLLIVGGLDRPVVDLNRAAFTQLTAARRKELKIIPGATHLFQERGALEQVAELAGEWFAHYLDSSGAGTSPPPGP